MFYLLVLQYQNTDFATTFFVMFFLCLCCCGGISIGIYNIYSAFVMLVHVVASSFFYFWNFFHVACIIFNQPNCQTEHTFFSSTRRNGVVLYMCMRVWRVRVQLNVIVPTIDWQFGAELNRNTQPLTWLRIFILHYQHQANLHHHFERIWFHPNLFFFVKFEFLKQLQWYQQNKMKETRKRRLWFDLLALYSV